MSETVGEYQFNKKDLIGHGAFAIVFKGRHQVRANETVAIKSIAKKGLPKSQSLLKKEIKILEELTKLKHENVVRLLDCKESAQCYFIVTEYCNGGDLADYLHRHGTLSEDTIRVFARQICRAMQALQSKGIIHRDLKPQNILLCYDNCLDEIPTPNNITLKIADFGFARFLQDGVMAATLCGSPQFMAVEILLSKPYDCRADLWSIGTILYQCLTGKAPFLAQSPQALRLFYERTQDLKPKIPSDTSPELADLLCNLLRREPEHRISFHDMYEHSFLKPPNSRPMPVPVRNSPQQTQQGASSSHRHSAHKSNLSGTSPLSIDSRVSHQLLKNTSVEGHDLSLSESSDSSDTAIAGDFVIVSSEEAMQAVDEQTCFAQNTYQQYSSAKDAVSHLQRMSPPAVCYAPAPSSALMRRSRSPSTSPISGRSPKTHQLSKSPTICGTRRISIEDVSNQQNKQYKTNISNVHMQQIVSANTSLSNSAKLVFTSGGGSLHEQRSRVQAAIQTAFSTKAPNFHSQAITDVSNIEPPKLKFNFDSPPGSALSLPSHFAICANGSIGSGSFASPPQVQGSPPVFYALELPEETLLDKEHNETLEKLAFIDDMINCILKFANSRERLYNFGEIDQDLIKETTSNCSPLNKLPIEVVCKIERFVLFLRVLHLSSSALRLGRDEILANRLRNSDSVKTVMRSLNDKFHKYLKLCKSNNYQSIIGTQDGRVALQQINPDKLIYDHAIEQCQSAAIEELFGRSDECFKRYHTAQILLHGLMQQVNFEDKLLLEKYKDAVEKRLVHLQQCRQQQYNNMFDNNRIPTKMTNTNYSSTHSS